MTATLTLPKRAPAGMTPAAAEMTAKFPKTPSPVQKKPAAIPRRKIIPESIRSLSGNGYRFFPEVNLRALHPFGRPVLSLVRLPRHPTSLFEKSTRIVIRFPILTERLTTQPVDEFSVQAPTMKANLHLSTQPVRLGACLSGFLMAVLSVIILAAEAVGAF